MPLEQILKEVCQAVGVRGCFLVAKEGDLRESCMPSGLDPGELSAVASSISRSLEALEVSRQHVQELDLTFSDGRVIVRNLPVGKLVLVCQAQINLPLLNLTLTPLTKRLAAEMAPASVSAREPSRSAGIVAPGGPAPLANREVSSLLERIIQEGQAIVRETGQVGLPVRIIGSAAVALHCPSGRQWMLPLSRPVVELVGRSSDSEALPEAFGRLGYVPFAPFNEEHRRQRLVFEKKGSGVWADLHLDGYDEFHRLEILEFLRAEEELLPPTELLLLGLQKAESADSDLRELVALLGDHELSAAPAVECIDMSRIAALCAEDWGWYRTATKNLDRLSFMGSWGGLPDLPGLPGRINRLREEIERAPKGARWQMRAAIGDTVRWYKQPTPVEGMPPRGMQPR